MTIVDWVIVAVVGLLALHGYRRGFLVGASSLIGFVLGAFIGARLAPLLLSGGSRSPYAAVFSLGGAILLGGLFGFLLEGAAARVRRVLWLPGFRLVDGMAGAVLTGAIGLGLAWIIGALMIQSANQLGVSAALQRDIDRSAILRALNGALPPSGPILNALARIDPLPAITGPIADVAAPNPAIVHELDVRQASASVVRILGNACGLGVEGSGWVAAPGVVVTNAHVIAGEAETVVQIGGHEPSLQATPILFDPHNDIAILRVSGLGLRSLSLAGDPAKGEAGAILGYPEDGPFAVEPGRLGTTQVTATQNAYGKPTFRTISSLRGLVRPGNSGGPLVDAQGQVLATVFAEITNPEKGRPGGFAVPNSVVETDLARALRTQTRVSTQTCAD
jgi:S1-C subfamily serine protease